MVVVVGGGGCFAPQPGDTRPKVPVTALMFHTFASFPVYLL